MGKTGDQNFGELHDLLAQHGQSHLLRFWDRLSEGGRNDLAAQITEIDFPLVRGLAEHWVVKQPKGETYKRIEPARLIAASEPEGPEHKEAGQRGDEALREGRVGLILVAGGQGTRLGYEGPKGAFPIGPVSKRSLFSFHAEKIMWLQERYGCTLPLYIMVSGANAVPTREFFEAHRYFGLRSDAVTFFQQDMVPCVDEEGMLLLEARDRIATNPNGHGGCIPALAKHGILADARRRGIDTLSYFQVDNWAVKVADRVFIGHHILEKSEFSSKAHRKRTPRESSGVFCRCDGRAMVIEYTEFDLYPQLLECDDAGNAIHYAANAAIHLLSVDFIEGVARNFSEFPWHCSHKAIARADDEGQSQLPEKPNGYKFETFIFDALRYCVKEPVILEIDRLGEFTPTKQMEGPGSVEEARQSMSRYWGNWLDAAGCPPGPGRRVEISPQFALTEEDFVDKTQGYSWPVEGDIGIGPDGDFIT